MGSKSEPLYVIASRHRQIFDAIDANDGELTPELETALDEDAVALPTKLDAIRFRILELRLEAGREVGEMERILGEWNRRKERKDRKDKEADNLEAYIHRSLVAAKEKRVDSPNYSFRVQNNPWSARWLGPPEEIPAAFRREKHTFHFDAKAALDAHRAGEALPDGVVVSQTTRLVIK